MYHRWWDGAAWGGWESLGGAILEAPDCVSWGPNRIDCFARGTDAAMWHRWWDGSAWGGWENLGGIILDKPDCVALGAEPDRLLRPRHRPARCGTAGGTAAAWGGWESLGGIILEKPDCVSWGSNRHRLLRPRHRQRHVAPLVGRRGLGRLGEPRRHHPERPDCVRWGPNRLDCFAPGTDNAHVPPLVGLKTPDAGPDRPGRRHRTARAFRRRCTSPPLERLGPLPRLND